jgi:hypothetical protein
MNYGNKWLSYINNLLAELDLKAEVQVPTSRSLNFSAYANIKFTNANGFSVIYDKTSIEYNGNKFYLDDVNNMSYYSGRRLLQILSTKARAQVFAEIMGKSNVWQFGKIYMLLEKSWSDDTANTYKINHASNSDEYLILKTFFTENGFGLTHPDIYRNDFFELLNKITPIYTKPFDFADINLEKCADADKNKIFVFRRGRNYGSFEIEASEVNDEMFARCSVSGYLTTGLANYFNERESIFNGSVRYIASIKKNSVKTCKDCGRTDYSSLDASISVPSLDVVKTYANSDICNACADIVIDSGLDINSYVPNLYAVGGHGSNPETMNFGKFDSEVVPLYMGVELEVDTQYGNTDDEDDYENDDNDEQYDNGERSMHSNITLHKIANNNKNIIFSKTDGSLANGFEIVSHPLTLATHLKKMQWQKGMDYLSKIGYKSHNTNTCGLHVHINRDFFGATKPIQNLNGSKIAYIMERNQADFVKFTRRKGGQLERWARFGDMQRFLSPQVSPRTKAMLLSAFRNQYSHRNKYVALNTIHANTFEFRVFKGTLNYATFVATLQLVDNLARLVKDIPNNNDAFNHLDKITFDDIVNYRPYAELTAYWNTRKVVS